jgi:hypothetical protein
MNQPAQDRLSNSLAKIDSSIRNGQFIYANREANKLLSEIKNGKIDVGKEYADRLLSSLKRTILFLRPIVDVYSQNQSSIEIARRIQCQKSLKEK